jgi:hypothetical protein
MGQGMRRQEPEGVGVGEAAAGYPVAVAYPGAIRWG